MQAFQDWWTEDLRDRPDAEWRDDERSRYRSARRDDEFFADESGEDEIVEQDIAPPRNAPRAVKPRPPAARAAKPITPMAKVQPPVRSPAPEPPVTQVQPDRPIVPASLVSIAGMTEVGVRGALGAPQEEKVRGQQKIWTYRGKGCSVEVIFFLDVTRNAYAALDHKNIGLDGRTALPGPCLQSAAAFQGQDR